MNKLSDEELAEMTAMLITGAVALLICAGFTCAIIFLSKKQGAANVLQADAVASEKGTKAAAEEIAKHVETSDTVDKLDKGEF